MMERMIAICGLNCATCEAYLATQANDETEKERIAGRWRSEYHHAGIDAAYITCDGCLAFDRRLGGHCLECTVRACGVARGVPNCAHCADYDGCETLAGFLQFAPQLKPTLDEMRRQAALR